MIKPHYRCQDIMAEHQIFILINCLPIWNKGALQGRPKIPVKKGSSFHVYWFKCEELYRILHTLTNLIDAQLK